MSPTRFTINGAFQALRDSFKDSPTARIAILVGLALLTSGCGGAFYGSTNRSVNTDGSDSDYEPSQAPATSTTTTTSTTATTSGSSPISVSVSGVGYVSTSAQVTTGKVLKITFTPGQQKTTDATTGQLDQYSMLGVYITVGSNTQATSMLSNGLYTGTAQKNAVLDFSSALPTTCASSTTCRQSVTITVDHPNSDYDCLIGLYCPWTHVPTGVAWNGTLSVQTDDTTSL
jgi:hypothetical protein